MSLKTSYYTCTLCEANCGIEVRTNNNKIEKILGDKKDVMSRGHICPKAPALAELYNDPDRLRRPMKKTATGWQEISWSEALDEVVTNFRRIQQNHGKDAIGMYIGNPSVHNTGTVLYATVLHQILGTKNRYSASSLDQWPHMFTSYQMFGHMLMFNIPDIERTDFMLMLGANPLASNGSIMTAPDVKKRLREIQGRGGKLAVIDPRKTETAQISDIYHSIIPGTDPLLLLSMLNVLFSENLVDLAHLKGIVRDFEKIEPLVRDFAPELTEEITGIKAFDVKELTREFAKAERAVLYPRVGASVHEFGVMNIWLCTLINILTGNLDREGGMMFTNPAFDIADMFANVTGKGSYDAFRSRVSKVPEVMGEFPVAVLAEELNTPGEGQIKGMITIAGNPVMSTPQGEAIDKGFAGLDFMVAVDIYLNETTRHADIILPPLVPLEKDHMDIVFPSLGIRNYLKYNKAVLPRPADSRSDAEIFIELISRLNPVGAQFDIFADLSKMFLNYLNVDRLLDFGIRMGPHGDKFNPFSDKLNLAKVKEQPHGIDLGPLQPRLPGRLFTDDKKVHLAPELMLKDLYRVKARFMVENDDDPDTLYLIGRRNLRMNNSWMNNLPKLAGERNLCTAMIHPETAQRLGIDDGELVKLTSDMGSLEIEAEISENIGKKVVSIPHGFGQQKNNTRQNFATTRKGANINSLLDNDMRDGLIGTSVLNGQRVTLQPIRKKQAPVEEELVAK